MTTRMADYPLWMRGMVVATLTLFAISVVSALMPSLTFILWFSNKLSAENVIAAIAALVGSFFGAWFAFRFARTQRILDRVENEVGAGNRALFVLSSMWNETKQHQIEIVAPYRGRNDAWINLNVGPPFNNDLAFDVHELAFLMQTNATVFQALFLEQQRYRLMAYLVEDHRRLVLEYTWPKLEAAGLLIGQSLPEAEIQAIIGIGTVQKLKVTTGGIIEIVDSNEKTLRDAFMTLRATLKSIHPTRKFIDVTFPATAA